MPAPIPESTDGRRADISAADVISGVPWYRHVAVTGSTNADLVDQAATLPVGAVLVADEQTAGVGRRGRHWASAPGTSLAMSVLLERPHSWLPLVGGLALQAAVLASPNIIPPDERTALSLKWPNDVLFHGKKIAGVLAHGAPNGRVVLGAGLNIVRRDLKTNLADVDMTDLVVPVATAVDANTSLGKPAVRVAPTPPGLLDVTGDHPGDTVRELIETYAKAVLAGAELLETSEAPDSLRKSYVEACSTVGQRVRVYPPTGDVWEGTAVGVGPSGALLVTASDGREHELLADEVRHIRVADDAGAVPTTGAVDDTASGDTATRVGEG